MFYLISSSYRNIRWFLCYYVSMFRQILFGENTKKKKPKSESSSLSSIRIALYCLTKEIWLFFYKTFEHTVCTHTYSQSQRKKKKTSKIGRSIWFLSLGVYIKNDVTRTWTATVNPIILLAHDTPSIDEHVIITMSGVYVCVLSLCLTDKYVCVSCVQEEMKEIEKEKQNSIHRNTHTKRSRMEMLTTTLTQMWIKKVKQMIV